MQYPYIPPGRDLKYVSENNSFMTEAKNIRNYSSTDKNHPTGAVLVKDGIIIGKSANQSKINNKYLLELHGKGVCIRKILKIKSGSKYWMCPGCASSKYHAEYGAVVDAQTKGVETINSDLYLFGHWWCCKPCWDKMIEAGVKDVYLVEGATEKYRDNKR